MFYGYWLVSHLLDCLVAVLEGLRMMSVLLAFALPFYSDCFGWVKLSCCYGYFFYHRRVIRSFGPSLLRLQRDCKGSQSTILGGVAISRCCMLPWMGWVLLSELNFATIGFSD